MTADTCPVCGTAKTRDGDWPCCGCDRNSCLILTVRETAWRYQERNLRSVP